MISIIDWARLRGGHAGLALILASALLWPATGAADSACRGTWWIEEGELAIGLQMPVFGFSTCDGAELSLAELDGQPLLINFWATWCPPCLKELPNFAELAEEQAGRIEVLGVALDEEAAEVEAFLSEVELPYRIAWDSAGIAADLGVQAIPLTVALDRGGRVVAVHRGYASVEDLERLAGAAMQEGR